MTWFLAGPAVRLARFPERDPTHFHDTAIEGVMSGPLYFGDWDALSCWGFHGLFQFYPAYTRAAVLRALSEALISASCTGVARYQYGRNDFRKTLPVLSSIMRKTFPPR